MIVSAVGISRAYEAGKVPGVGGSAGIVPSGPAPAQGSGFAQFMETSIQNAIDSVRTGERMSAAGLEGKASAQDVVQAVLSAELTVQAVVAVRDKLVNAYLDVMRMPI